MKGVKINLLITWLQSRLTPKQFIMISCVLVGLSAGLAALVLKIFAHEVFMIATLENNSVSKFTHIILPIIGIVLTVFVVQKLFKGKFDKGLSNIHDSIKKESSSIPKEQMYKQVITSSLTVGLGGSAGLEAPIVITGAAFGSNYAKTYNLDISERTLLLACGVSAGIAAAFNAPIAGVLFALEVLLVNASISIFTPIILASASGALISKIILQNEVLLSFESQQPFDYYNIPFYVILGAFAGLLSVYHSRIFNKIQKAFSQSKKNAYLKAIAGGTILSLLVFIFPSLFGEGYKSVEVLSLNKPEELFESSPLSIFNKNELLVLIFIGILIFLKAIATGLTIGSGGNGGNFAPSLFVGAYLGFFFSRLINILNISNLPESNFTLVGMAGILSGIYHAPLTAIFLIAEITGGYKLMIPLMVVASISFVISKQLEPKSMDTMILSPDSSDKRMEHSKT